MPCMLATATTMTDTNFVWNFPAAAEDPSEVAAAAAEEGDLTGEVPVVEGAADHQQEEVSTGTSDQAKPNYSSTDHYNFCFLPFFPPGLSSRVCPFPVAGRI